MEPAADTSVDLYIAIVEGRRSYWDVVYQPYMDRELNRRQVRSVIHKGLARAGGSYQELVKLFNMPAGEYQKFMDHLRHHRLKPGT